MRTVRLPPAPWEPTPRSIRSIVTEKSRLPWVRRHKAVTGLLVCALLLIGTAGGLVLWVNHRIGDIPRMDLGLTEPDTGGEDTGAPGRAVNVLLMGSDSRDPGAVARMVESGWEPGSMRSDTLMLVHISADREGVSAVSIPRDTWVDVPGHGPNKINAAFSYGGPALALKTVEQFTGVQIDHVVVVDWEGFKGVTDALGGVEVDLPQRGTTRLDGEEALAYVRERYNLPNGDFDRIARQQNFMRALATELINAGSLTNPIRLARTVDAIAPSLTVDSSLDNARLRDIGFSMRDVGNDDLTFATVPLDAYARRGGGQSVVLVDTSLVRRMFAALDEDRLPSFLERERLAELPPPDQVS